MKTMEQVIEDFYGSQIPPDWDREHEPMENTSINDIKNLMKEYARQACEEQRNLCAKNADIGFDSIHDIAEWAIKEKIRNAPEPELK